MSKAIRIHGYGGSDVLQVEEIPAPTAGPGEVLVTVKAMGVNPVDWKVRSGFARARFEISFPAILGGDIAGVVEAVGPGVTGYKAGDDVFGMTGLTGAYAQQVVTSQDNLAPKPKNLTFIEAASVPLAALTAWQALADVAGIKQGDTVLVHAASGGVGGFAVQIARVLGAAHVIGTTSAANADYVLGLGAERVIDYKAVRFEDEVADVDIVFDLLGGDVANRSLGVVRKGGIVVSAGGPAAGEKAAELGVRAASVGVKPNGARLAEIGRLIEAGKIKTEIATVYPMADVAKAHDASQAGRTRGKIVLDAA